MSKSESREIKPRVLSAFVAIFCLSVQAPVHAAGAADRERPGKAPDAADRGPPPELIPIYEFAGALNIEAGAVSKATVVQCTNIDPATDVDVVVELYDFDAADVYIGTISISPLATATFESSQVDFYVADVFMNAGRVEQGLGRILASHPRIVCTAQTVDPDNSPPTWSFDLQVYRSSQ